MRLLNSECSGCIVCCRRVCMCVCVCTLHNGNQMPSFINNCHGLPKYFPLLRRALDAFDVSDFQMDSFDSGSILHSRWRALLRAIILSLSLQMGMAFIAIHRARRKESFDWMANADHQLNWKKGKSISHRECYLLNHPIREELGNNGEWRSVIDESKGTSRTKSSPVLFEFFYSIFANKKGIICPGRSAREKCVAAPLMCSLSVTKMIKVVR